MHPGAIQEEEPDLRLSPRLKAVADLVPPCRIVFDIGTDHAKLPLYLVKAERCQAAVAADLRSGPLRQAEKNIQKHNLQNRVSTILTDGLNGLSIQSEDVVVLAGLGGLEICRILSGAPACRQMIVQAMKHLPQVRRWLHGQGYRIVRETLATERGRFYPVLAAAWQGEPEELDDLPAWIGPCLIRQPTPLLIAYVHKLLRQLQLQIRSGPELRPVAEELAAWLKERGAT